MVSFLTGVMRSPFTAAILVLEMTDRRSAIFQLLLSGTMARRPRWRARCPGVVGFLSAGVVTRDVARIVEWPAANSMRCKNCFVAKERRLFTTKLPVVVIIKRARRGLHLPLVLNRGHIMHSPWYRTDIKTNRIHCTNHSFTSLILTIMKKVISPVIFMFSALVFGGCTMGGNIASDANSTNPAVAQQAQKVQYLQDQVKAQKAVADAEKQKLDGLEQQLQGAEQNLKGVKTQSKAQ